MNNETIQNSNLSSRIDINNKANKPKICLFPFWLRLIIVVFLITMSILSGLIVGYGIIGNGKPSDALKISTWTHIQDLIETDK